MEKRNHYDRWVEEIRSKIDVAAEQLDDLRSVVDHQGEGVDGETAIAAL